MRGRRRITGPKRERGILKMLNRSTDRELSRSTAEDFRSRKIFAGTRVLRAYYLGITLFGSGALIAAFVGVLRLRTAIAGGHDYVEPLCYFAAAHVCLVMFTVFFLTGAIFVLKTAIESDVEFHVNRAMREIQRLRQADAPDDA
jgi:hypothetical protein